MASRDVPRLVLFMANDCGHCVSLKDRWFPKDGDKNPSLKQRIESLKSVKIEEVMLTSRKNSVPTPVGKYVLWFPFFILVDGNAWASGNVGPESISVFNGTVSSSGSVNTKIEHNMTFEGLRDWINKALPTITKQKPVSKPVPEGVPTITGLVNSQFKRGTYSPTVIDSSRQAERRYVPTSGSKFQCGTMTIIPRK